MSSKEQREQIMSDEKRIAAWIAKGKRCDYCHGQRLIETITDRLFGCCNKCAEWDNNARVVKKSLPCVCCGKQLTVACGDEEFTINTVDHQGFNDGMAGGISTGYGSRFDTNVYMIALCDNCIEQKQAEGRLTFVYSYMPNIDGTPSQC